MRTRQERALFLCPRHRVPVWVSVFAVETDSVTSGDVGFDEDRCRILRFVESVLRLINGFYGDVVHHVTPWLRPTPKLEAAETVEQIDESP